MALEVAEPEVLDLQRSVVHLLQVDQELSTLSMAPLLIMPVVAEVEQDIQDMATAGSVVLVAVVLVELVVLEPMVLPTPEGVVEGVVLTTDRALPMVVVQVVRASLYYAIQAVSVLLAEMR